MEEPIVWKGTLEDLKTQKFKGRNTIELTCPKCGKTYTVKFATVKGKKRNLLCHNCASKATILEHFGSYEAYKEHFVASHKETFLKKYGVDHPMHVQAVRDKIVETNMERYGVPYTTQAEEVKEKMEATFLKKYGYTNPNKAESVKQKIRDTCMERYGVPNGNQAQVARDSTMEKYGVENHNWVHMTEEQRDIYLNPDKLKAYLDEHFDLTTTEIASNLGVTSYSLGKRLHRYGMEEYLGRFARSTPEKELYSFLTKCIDESEIQTNQRSVIKPYELDIYIPSKNIAIEFDGNYWHSDGFLAKRHENHETYHQTKTLMCKEKGIHLIHIFEYEWKDANKKDKILAYIEDLLKPCTTIYARQCTVMEVASKESNAFLEANHLQGKDNAPIRLGLYHEGNLVSLMTFSKPRFNKNVEWELSRYVTSRGMRVTGGASRLLKHFEDAHKPSSLISYCNLSKMTGNVYEKLGFTLKSISEPNYVWYKYNSTALTRYQTQKHKLIEQGFEGATEKEIMESQGYERIYDAGNAVYIKEYK